MTFEIILMILAGIVFIGQVTHLYNPWIFICIYWGTLTIKYIKNNYGKTSK